MRNKPLLLLFGLLALAGCQTATRLPGSAEIDRRRSAGRLRA